MSDTADKEAQQQQAYRESVEKAVENLRGVAKWVVGGVAITTGGVVAGSSLTALGSLDWAWRLQLATAAAAIGLALLGWLMWFALDVLVPRGYSMLDVSRGEEISPADLRQIEAKIHNLFLGDETTLRAFVDNGIALGQQAKQPAATVATVEQAKQHLQRLGWVRTAVMLQHNLLLFSRLKIRLFLITPLIALAFGLFAWAANPGKPAAPPPPASPAAAPGAADGTAPKPNPAALPAGKPG